MSDLEKLKELLTSFGVGFELIKTNYSLILRCEEGGAKIEGYCGFYTNFEFDKEGKFLGMGAYE